MFVTVTALKYAYGHFLKLTVIQFYLNNTINLRHLTQHIRPPIFCYTHKMAIVS